jgi:hypothetical protein
MHTPWASVCNLPSRFSNHQSAQFLNLYLDYQVRSSLKYTSDLWGFRKDFKRSAVLCWRYVLDSTRRTRSVGRFVIDVTVRNSTGSLSLNHSRKAITDVSAGAGSIGVETSLMSADKVLLHPLKCLAGRQVSHSILWGTTRTAPGDHPLFDLFSGVIPRQLALACPTTRRQ